MKDTPTRIKIIRKGIEREQPETFAWGDLLFITDASCTEYDWLIVYDEFPKGSTGTRLHPVPHRPRHVVPCAQKRRLARPRPRRPSLDRSGHQLPHLAHRQPSRITPARRMTRMYDTPLMPADFLLAFFWQNSIMNA